MILEVNKTEFSEKDIKDLRYINNQATVSLVYAANSIYDGVKKQMKEECKKDGIWIHLSSLSCLMVYGYMLGVRTEREKKRKKKAPNNGDRG